MPSTAANGSLPMKPSLVRYLLVILLLTGMALAFLYRDAIDVAALQSWAERAGPIAPLLYVGVYAIGTLLFLPGAVMTLAGGVVFGPVWGTLYNLTGATLGAALAFLTARYLASNWVERRSGGRLEQLKSGVENAGWRFVAFTRLVPLFPFNLLNYALGLTRIPLLHYLITSWLCMLPGALAYTYLGYAGREAMAIESGFVEKGLLALSLLAAVAFLPRLVASIQSGGRIAVDDKS
jgi:uncharacterized membrane protein YdjX (TVP38/TMEM64 family)